MPDWFWALLAILFFLVLLGLVGAFFFGWFIVATPLAAAAPKILAAIALGGVI
jgi:hypothetical protein